MSDSAFYSALSVLAAVWLVLLSLDAWDRWRRPPAQDANKFEQARRDRIDAAHLAAFYELPTKGPHGFRAQNERRRRQNEESSARAQIVVVSPTSRTASKGRVN